MPVRFLKSWNNYFPKDIAVFQASVEKQLIESGVAMRYTTQPEVPESPAPKPDKTKKWKKTQRVSSQELDEILKVIHEEDDPSLKSGETTDQTDDGGTADQVDGATSEDRSENQTDDGGTADTEVK